MYMQTTLVTTPNIVERPSNVGKGHIWVHVAKHLTDFKLCTTTPNNTQQHATVYANGHKGAAGKYNNYIRVWLFLLSFSTVECIYLLLNLLWLLFLFQVPLQKL